jgi:hypothetical protein
VALDSRHLQLRRAASSARVAWGLRSLQAEAHRPAPCRAGVLSGTIHERRTALPAPRIRQTTPPGLGCEAERGRDAAAAPPGTSCSPSNNMPTTSNSQKQRGLSPPLTPRETPHVEGDMGSLVLHMSIASFHEPSATFL